LAAENFVTDFLIRSLGAAVAVCGYNFKFGKGASGDSETLCKLMKSSGAEAEVVEEYKADGVPLSSTYIRTLLSERRIREAAKLLGKPYFISGMVSHGLGLGKKLGIPTVNVELPSGRFVLPAGVYATLTAIGDKLFPSLTNVGVCPTFNERQIHTETFILNFNDDVYNENIRIYFVDFLRNEKKFSNAEELLMQINVDKTKTLKLFGDIKWQELGLN
jgi:riboflavin kinase/FMN adenylyltransferase